MNYQHLNVEVGPLFRRSLKFRPLPSARGQIWFQQSNCGRRKCRGLSQTQQTLSTRTIE